MGCVVEVLWCKAAWNTHQTVAGKGQVATDVPDLKRCLQGGTRISQRESRGSWVTGQHVMMAVAKGMDQHGAFDSDRGGGTHRGARWR